MRIVPFRIPKQVVLPGMIVQVRVVPPTPKTVTGEETLYSKQADFGYNPETKTALIRLASDLTNAEARYALLHELQHVMVDYLHVALLYHAKHFKVS